MNTTGVDPYWEALKETDHTANYALTSALSTFGAQIFLMQLGFLCFEVGSVAKVWVNSIIIKNIEDTFVGITTFCVLGYTLSAGNSKGGFIGGLNHMFLAGVPNAGHEEVFIGAGFATTTATIMSGAILERMKNKGYIMWCFLVILVNYSLIAHWVWNSKGWLADMGFMDGAGGGVVHMTGAIPGLVAVWFLGPRGQFARTGSDSQPLTIAIGTFLLWYGWFAFNVSSPVAAGLDIGNRVGTTALNTLIAPCSSVASCYLILQYFEIKASFEHLISCCLAGLVAVTGGCFTVPVWSSYIIGFLASPIYFAVFWLQERYELDDPLAIGPIHGACGFAGLIFEGIFADGVGGRSGLIHGNGNHFGVQLLGAFVIGCTDLVLAVALWKGIMEQVVFRGQIIRVTALDTYLGTDMFKMSPRFAFEEMIKCDTSNARQMLLGFHCYLQNKVCDEQLDFLVAVNVFRMLCRDLLAEGQVHAEQGGENRRKTLNQPRRATKASEQQRVVFESIVAIAECYLRPYGPKQVNLTDMSRTLPLKLIDTCREKHLVLTEETIFDVPHGEIFKQLLVLLQEFLDTYDSKKFGTLESSRIPYVIDSDWRLHWPQEEEMKRNAETSSQQSSEKTGDVQSYSGGGLVVLPQGDEEPAKEAIGPRGGPRASRMAHKQLAHLIQMVEDVGGEAEGPHGGGVEEVDRQKRGDLTVKVGKTQSVVIGGSAPGTEMAHGYTDTHAAITPVAQENADAQRL